MRWLALPLLLGLAHGVTDGVVGWLLGSLIQTLPLPQVGLMLLLYNFLAFAGQPVAGLLVDRLKRPRTAVLVALLLTSAVLLVGRADPISAVALAGLGSALFHVGGGALALGATPGRAAGPGIFAAPGVLGVALGGIPVAVGTGAMIITPPGILLIILVALPLLFWSLQRAETVGRSYASSP